MKKAQNFIFNTDKNKKLLAERGIGFEEVILELEANRKLDVIEHPNKDRYPNQKMFIVEIDGYVYVVPFIQDEDNFYLKTIFPSRKLTRKYLFDTPKE